MRTNPLVLLIAATFVLPIVGAQSSEPANKAPPAYIECRDIESLDTNGDGKGDTPTGRVHSYRAKDSCSDRTNHPEGKGPKLLSNAIASGGEDQMLDFYLWVRYNEHAISDPSYPGMIIDYGSFSQQNCWSQSSAVWSNVDGAYGGAFNDEMSSVNFYTCGASALAENTNGGGWTVACYATGSYPFTDCPDLEDYSLPWGGNANDAVSSVKFWD